MIHFLACLSVNTNEAETDIAMREHLLQAPSGNIDTRELPHYVIRDIAPMEAT